MLNGAHSLLAYCGLDRGHEFVHQAIGDPLLRNLVVRLMRQEAAPSIGAAPGQDLDAYAADLVARFENPALRHRLAQIAMDGSQKIPQRWLETLAERASRDVRCPAILTALAAWLRHVRGDLRPVDDPLADALKALWRRAGADQIVKAMFGEGGLIASPWKPTGEDEAFVTARLG
jgi:fructuronate reductase